MRLAAALVFATLAAAQPAMQPFLIGWNLPWAGYGHDFGANAWGHDGLSTSGWAVRRDSAFLAARRVAESNCGRPALRIMTDLGPVRPSGEIELSVVNHPPRQDGLPAFTPLNLEGATARARLWLPPGSAGAGLQLFFKSQISDGEFPSLYSPWTTIQPSWEGTCVEVTAAAGAGERFGAFDATRVSQIGLKLATTSGATARISGFIELESFTAGTATYGFERLEVESDLAAAAELSGGQWPVVRVFVFADGRAAPEFAPDGSVTGLDERFFDDFDELLRAAERTGTRVMPVLMDYLWCSRARVVSGAQLGGRAAVIRDPAKRQAFFDRALEPPLRRYGGHPWIHAWEIMNEPEWAMAGVPGSNPADIEPVPAPAMQDFVRLCAERIHRLTAHPATLGGARRMWLGLWRQAGLRLYQFHWYDQFDRTEPFPFVPYAELGLDRPCLIGEVPTANTRIAPGRFLEAARAGGYAGLMWWSFRARDEASDFAAAVRDFAARTPRIAGVVNAASFAAGAVAPESLASLFGENLDGSALTIGGQPARVIYSSPGQINFVAPAGLNSGPATLRVARLDGGSAAADLQIDAVSPGVFAATVMCAECEQIVVTLWATGLRYGAVAATIDGENVPVLYAGPQWEFPGLDQVNLLVPSGRDKVVVALTANGKPANKVEVVLRR